MSYIIPKRIYEKIFGIKYLDEALSNYGESRGKVHVIHLKIVDGVLDKLQLTEELRKLAGK